MKLATSLAVAAALAAAAPASAAPVALTAGGSFARTVPFIDGTIYAFECHAVAPGASSVRITNCTLTDGFHNISAPASTAVGSAGAVTTEAVATTPLSQWRVCWTAVADGLTKSGCSTASQIAGAG